MTSNVVETHRCFKTGNGASPSSNVVEPPVVAAPERLRPQLKPPVVAAPLDRDKKE